MARQTRISSEAVTWLRLSARRNDASRFSRTRQHCLGALILACSVATGLGAAEASSAIGASFSKDIAPVLAAKCVTCHGPEKAKSGYRLDSFAALMKPGDSKEPPVSAGTPEKSQLFQLITAKDPDDRMPQKDEPLPAKQIALIERWIKEGAKFDGADPKQPLASLVAAGPQPGPPAVYARPVPVLAIAFSPDGQELAAAGYHEITLWNPTSGELLRRLTNVAQQTQALAFSPDGSLLATASGTPGKLGEVKLFNPAKGSLLKTLVGAADLMLAVSFSPDGKRLAVSGADNTIRIFEVASGTPQLLIEQHADWVMGLAFSPDGSTLASASRDKTARLFDATTGELEQTYTGHNAAVFSVAFSADGKRVFSASRDKEIHVWETKDAKKITEIGGFKGDVMRVLVNDDAIFRASTDRVVRQHSFAEKKAELTRTFSGHADVIYGLALHEATHRLATSGYDGDVRVWNIDDGKLLTSFMAAPGYQSTASHAHESPKKNGP
jgi:WD40 repeat protein